MTTVGLVGIALLCASPDAPLTLGAKHELFLDDALIAASRNVTRRVHPAEKHPGNPLLRPTEPWEGAVTIVYGSVLREGEKYRMWRHARQRRMPSADGSLVKLRLPVRIGGETRTWSYAGSLLDMIWHAAHFYLNLRARAMIAPDPQAAATKWGFSASAGWSCPRNLFHPRGVAAAWLPAPTASAGSRWTTDHGGDSDGATTALGRRAPNTSSWGTKHAAEVPRLGRPVGPLPFWADRGSAESPDLH